MSPYDSLINPGAQEASNSFSKGGWLSSLRHSDKPKTLPSPGLHCHPQTYTEGRTGTKLLSAARAEAETQEEEHRPDPHLKGASLRNLSRNCCCWVSKAVHLWRRRATSFACSGATCCLTVAAIFLVFFHFSGSSCKEDLGALTPILLPLPYSQRTDTTLDFHPLR